MIKRFYADNFRCLTNFELELDEANVLLGANGTGKTSVLTVLRRIQRLVVGGARVDEVFPARDLTLSGNRKEQRFEIQSCFDGQTYDYGLTIEHERSRVPDGRDRGKMRITAETLNHDGRRIFEFRRGEAQLFHDDYETGPKFPFDWTLSGIGMLHERRDNQKLTEFKKNIRNFIIVHPCPPFFEPEARTEDESLEPLMRNFVGWYRHYAQENMGSIAELFESLRDCLPGFQFIRLSESGEDSRALKAVFDGTADAKKIDYGFDQLSDGQRALIALYSLILLTGDRRASLFIDEPDNYLALREIQPWLVQTNKHCGKSLEQLVVISHHPVIIDYMAGSSGRWFFRDGDGPVRVSEKPKSGVDGLSISETIARGWDE